MSISIIDLPFAVTPEVAARWEFDIWGKGVQARCGACSFAYGFGPTALSKLRPARSTPVELGEHRCNGGDA